MICNRDALRQPLSLLYARISQRNDNLAGFILRERESGGTRFQPPFVSPLVPVSVASNTVPFHTPLSLREDRLVLRQLSSSRTPRLLRLHMRQVHEQLCTSTVILALEATSSFLPDNCRENGFSCHIDSLIIAHCNTHT